MALHAAFKNPFSLIRLIRSSLRIQRDQRDQFSHFKNSTGGVHLIVDHAEGLQPFIYLQLERMWGCHEFKCKKGQEEYHLDIQNAFQNLL